VPNGAFAKQPGPSGPNCSASGCRRVANGAVRQTSAVALVTVDRDGSGHSRQRWTVDRGNAEDGSTPLWIPEKLRYRSRGPWSSRLKDQGPTIARQLPPSFGRVAMQHLWVSMSGWARTGPLVGTDRTEHDGALRCNAMSRDGARRPRPTVRGRRIDPSEPAGRKSSQA
jgi:hypothetical protein